MKDSLIRVGGITAVLGGVCLLLMAGFQAFNRGGIEDYPLIAQTITLMPILLLLGAVGLFALANGHRGVQVGAGVIALGTLFMAVGFAMMVWLNNDNGWMVMSGAMVLLPLGILLFGLVNWRVQVLPRWNKLPLIVGLIATLLMFLSFSGLVAMAEQQTEWLFAIYLLTLGVGWVLLGVAMLLGDRETAVPKTATISLLLLVLLLTACGGIGGNNESKVSFQSPKAGASVSNPVHVVMQAENFTVETAGDVHDNAGHLHIMIDTPCLAAGEVIPKDDNHRHFGDGSTEADLELSSGTHTLCLQAADGVHIALEGEGMTHEISVTVP